jgi:hypothetical protein
VLEGRRAPLFSSRRGASIGLPPRPPSTTAKGAKTLSWESSAATYRTRRTDNAVQDRLELGRKAVTAHSVLLKVGHAAWWASLALAIAGLAFRSLVWASWVPYPNEPYAASGILELLTVCLLLVVCRVCVLVGGILVRLAAVAYVCWPPAYCCQSLTVLFIRSFPPFAFGSAHAASTIAPSLRAKIHSLMRGGSGL